MQHVCPLLAHASLLGLTAVNPVRGVASCPYPHGFVISSDNGHHCPDDCCLNPKSRLCVHDYAVALVVSRHHPDCSSNLLAFPPTASSTAHPLLSPPPNPRSPSPHLHFLPPHSPPPLPPPYPPSGRHSPPRPAPPLGRLVRLLGRAPLRAHARPPAGPRHGSLRQVGAPGGGRDASAAGERGG